MNISSKNLLETASNIINKRKNIESNSEIENKSLDNKDNSNSSNLKKIHTSPTTTISENNNKVLKLQDELRNLQVKYTKEQVRADYLINHPNKIDENLEFEGEALFPDFKNKNLNQLNKSVKNQMESLLHNMKSVQIEIENIYALNFQKVDTQKIKENITVENVKKIINTIDLNPERVAKLTRN